MYIHYYNSGHFNLPSERRASFILGGPLESSKDNGVDREHVRDYFKDEFLEKQTILWYHIYTNA